jgi:hypothetical protein
MPLLDRDLLVVSDECVHEAGLDWPKLVWVLDARREDNLVSISTLPLPSVEGFRRKGQRYGAHNMHENRPGPAFRSNTLIFGTYFSGGLRVHDLTDPFNPKEVAHFVPPAPPNAPTGAIQINDVYVDENELVYAVDRHAGGLYILQMKI